MGASEESPSASIDAQRPAQDPRTLIVTIAGRIERADATRFGGRVEDQLSATPTTLVVCDVGGLLEPDAAAVDSICRIRLAVRRLGGQFRLRGASAEVVELLDMIGLCGVLAVAPGSGLQPRGQPEERKQPRRVEEEGDPADSIA